MKKLKSILFIAALLFVTATVNAQQIIDAIRGNDPGRVKMIIQADPQAVNYKDDRNCTPLHYAADVGNSEIFNLLIANGADLSAKDIDGDTPMHWAALGRNSEIVKLLLEKGADPSPMNKNGDTPIIYAIGRLPEEIVDLMLDYGAEFDATGGKALNVLQLSARFGLERLFKIASEKGGPSLFTDSSVNIETLKSAILGGSIEFVKLMVDKGVDVNSVSKYRGRPLDIAYENGNNQIIEYLKSKGAEYTPMDFETKKLSESLLRITLPWGMRNNMIAFGENKGLIIIDAGFSKRAVDAIKKTITGFDDGGIRYVVNSHSHWDHIAGNSGLAPTEDAVIGLSKIEDGSLQHLVTKLDKSMVGRSGLTLPLQYVMKFNSQNIFFFPYPGLHSSEDMLIYFPESNVLYLGDLLLSQSCPAIENVSGYMELLNKILDIFPSECTFISGHGEDLTYSGMKKYRDDICAMNEIVIKEFQLGKSVEDILAANVLGDYKADYSHLDWLGPDMWIRRVFENLASGILK